MSLVSYNTNTLFKIFRSKTKNSKLGLFNLYSILTDPALAVDVHVIKELDPEHEGEAE